MMKNIKERERERKKREKDKHKEKKYVWEKIWVCIKIK